MPDSSAEHKRILVTGSRLWSASAPVREALLAHGPGLVVHGGARGLDTIAASVAKRLGWPTERHEVTSREWEEHGPSAGHRRNQAMVDLGAAVCLAFPELRSRGTFDCAARAERAKIPLVWVLGEGVTPEYVRSAMAEARRSLEWVRLHGRVA